MSHGLPDGLDQVNLFTKRKRKHLIRIIRGSFLNRKLGTADEDLRGFLLDRNKTYGQTKSGTIQSQSPGPPASCGKAASSLHGIGIGECPSLVPLALVSLRGGDESPGTSALEFISNSHPLAQILLGRFDAFLGAQLIGSVHGLLPTQRREDGGP